MRHDFLESPIEFLKGVGPQKAEILKKELGIFTFGDARFDGAFPDNTLDCVGMALRA